MVDLALQVPETEPISADAATLTAIDRGVMDADAGRTVSLEEAAELIPHWISKFASQNPR